MSDYSITFDAPGFLALLAMVPVLWWWSYRRLAALGPARRIASLAVRSLVLGLLILALAEVQWIRTSDRLTVVYVLDQSASIPEARRRTMIEYVNRSILEHRGEEDRVGVIVFGRDAAIEIPPFDDDVQVPPAIESLLDPTFTNLAGALKLAQASFPEDAAKRVVVVSDGNENLGSALEQAQALSGAGIGIDVVPIRYKDRPEVIVERLTIPSDVRRGAPFNMRAVVTNTTKPSPGRSGEIAGRLVLSELVGDQSVVRYEQHVTLPPGKSVFTVPEQIDEPAFYKYEIQFVPDRPEDDGVPQNNYATTFTHVRGKGQVLLVEDEDNQGEFDLLVKRLRALNMEVTVQPTGRLFSDLAELQQFDTILLGDVPRERFTDEQIEMLVRNTEMGAGLVMLGGPSSFGAGGWANTKLEEAMPVDFQIKSAKVIPRGALAMIMHASEMAEGNYWQKVIAKEALKALGPRDYCGVLHWNGRDQWLWRGGMIEIGDSDTRKKMLAYLDRMTPGDMPLFEPAMQMARAAFAKLPDAAVKHMIIISDGDPTAPGNAILQALANLKVTVTTVAVGAHGQIGAGVLQRIANATGGKYYIAKNPRALPRIFQREARRVARPLIFESKQGVQPQIRFPHEMLSGLGEALPPLNGFVMTTVKESPLVEVALVSPIPAEEKNSTILASWPYELGRAVAFTTDTGARWTNPWTRWEGYDKFFSQMVRWSMRPTDQAGKFSTSLQVKDGQGQIVINALDKNDEFLNFLTMSGRVIGPDLKPIDVKIEQTHPGRYVGQFPATASGTYFFIGSPGAGQAPILAGLSVPYSSEFRDRTTNESLLVQLAELAPKGGQAGKVIESTDPKREIDDWLAVNTFRRELPKATSTSDAWHLVLLVAGCLFFVDVFVRRVQVSFAWVPAGLGRMRDFVLRRQSEAPQPEFMTRLRSRKAEVSEQLDRLRSEARFEAPADAPRELGSVEELAGPEPPARPKPPPATAPPPAKEEESYTERLLKAKRKVWENRKEDKP